MSKSAIRYVPNALSTTRILLACVFPFSPEWLWLWLVLGSGCSDFLDGWVARRWQVQSWQGGLLDGVADKLFILCALTTFIAAGKFSAWWLPALLSRDLLVAFTAIYALSIRSWESFKKMDARWSGKIATLAQFLLFLVVLLFPHKIWPALCGAALFSVGAAGDYGWLFLLELRLREKEKRTES
ncbi:MAG: CDP-alcohol phosphatidyltransferase family protein [Proteobacteria bacterium]|nr:CDP-alcohol phosphatidyltransferase family protein [Pseudomonadota bacterium]MBU1060763.1 CDP-alcohol phosphatidyltransferase family protein [Pseudomonadota bacterium]